MKLLILAAPLLAHALTQSECLDIVMDEAKLYTNYPTTIAGKAMQESSCRNKIAGDLKNNLSEASLGVMQFQIKTAREVLKTIPELKHTASLSDCKLGMALLSDIRLSTRLASVRFEQYRKRLGYKRAVQAHNGLNGNFKYYKKVRGWMRWLKEQRKN